MFSGQLESFVESGDTDIFVIIEGAVVASSRGTYAGAAFNGYSGRYGKRRFPASAVSAPETPAADTLNADAIDPHHVEAAYFLLVPGKGNRNVLYHEGQEGFDSPVDFSAP